MHDNGRECRKLRVLIVGQHTKLDHVLVRNIQSWGHEVVVLPATAALWGSDVAGDVLLYDLDESVSPAGTGGSFAALGYDYGSLQPLALNADGMREERWPHVRLTIALSSHSVSRMTLEQIGAVALVQKPFEMGRLQRYLRVIQRLFLEQDELQHPSRKVRILVVDDDVAVAEAVRQCLEFETHYEVSVAHDGLEALEQFLDWRPHILVTDLIMPWMNGYQVMRCLSANSVHALPAFVILSALTELEMPWNRPSMQGKAVVYVNKPFNLDHLLSAVEQVRVESRAERN